MRVFVRFMYMYHTGQTGIVSDSPLNTWLSYDPPLCRPPSRSVYRPPRALRPSLPRSLSVCLPCLPRGHLRGPSSVCLRSRDVSSALPLPQPCPNLAQPPVRVAAPYRSRRTLFCAELFLQLEQLDVERLSWRGNRCVCVCVCVCVCLRGIIRGCMC